MRVDTNLLTASIVAQTLVDVIASTSIPAEEETLTTTTRVASGVVVAVVAAALLAFLTLVYISASLPVGHQAVAAAAGADGSLPRVLTLVVAAPVADGAEVDHLHLDSVA